MLPGDVEGERSVREDIGASERMVREWQERATEKAEKLGRMQERVEQITVTESSKDGAVRVTVSSKGILQGIELAETASRRTMPQLGAEIMRTVQKAQSRIPDLMQEAVADTIGVDGGVGQHLMGEARRHFPEPPEDEEPAVKRGSGLSEMRYDVDEDDRPTTDQRTPPPKPPPSRPEPQQPPTRRPRNDFDDDDDFGGGSFLR